MELFTGILSAFGLSASAGLNAYIPLLIIALTARFTGWITLKAPWDALENPWIIGLLAVLAAVEFFADKVPAVNHANDLIQTVIRPAAGAVLFAASTGAVSGMDPILAMAAGLVVAGSVHAVKSVAVRPAVTATTAGAGNVPVSIAEDVISTIVSFLSVLAPLIFGGLLLILAIFILWRLARRKSPQRGRAG